VIGTALTHLQWAEEELRLCREHYGDKKTARDVAQLALLEDTGTEEQSTAAQASCDEALHDLLSAVRYHKAWHAIHAALNTRPEQVEARAEAVKAAEATWKVVHDSENFGAGGEESKAYRTLKQFYSHLFGGPVPDGEAGEGRQCWHTQHQPRHSCAHSWASDSLT
jgi:hypothetical protein